MKQLQLPLDSRLLLFRALDFGLVTGRIKSSFFQGIKKEIAILSYEISKRYFRSNYKKDLELSVECCFGIIDVALEDSFGRNKEEALGFVIEKGIKHIFRQGWTSVHKIAVGRVGLLSNTEEFVLDDIGKERLILMAIKVSSDSLWDWDNLWRGIEAYRRFQLEYQVSQVYIALIQRFYSWYNKRDVILVESVGLTILASLLIFEGPRGLFHENDFFLMEKVIINEPESLRSLYRKIDGIKMRYFHQEEDSFRYILKKLENMFEDIRLGLLRDSRVMAFYLFCTSFNVIVDFFNANEKLVALYFSELRLLKASEIKKVFSRESEDDKFKELVFTESVSRACKMALDEKGYDYVEDDDSLGYRWKKRRSKKLD